MIINRSIDFLKVIAVLAGLSACSSQAVSMQNICNDDETIECLKVNFDKLYSENYELFWRILHKASKKSEECSEPEDLVDLLSLLRVGENNAEFTEYVSERLEHFLIHKTTCFFDALVMVEDELRDLVLRRLNNPMFISRAEVDRVFDDAKFIAKYREVYDLYFDIISSN